MKSISISAALLESRLGYCEDSSTRDARALDYPDTGTGVESRVIQRDVKSSNVLLDDKLTAKIFDFGVPAFNLALDEQQHSLAGWAKHCLKEGKMSQIIDLCLRGQVSSNYLKEFRKIAYECLLTSLKDKPTMTNVLSRLEFVLAWTLRSPQSINDQKGNGRITFIEKARSLLSTKAPMPMSSGTKKVGQNNMSP
nr:serine/threonine/dual specificity protein kinase, catalytic domain-containing protein [Tanacetum cinerariifolium]